MLSVNTRPVAGDGRDPDQNLVRLPVVRQHDPAIAGAGIEPASDRFSRAEVGVLHGCPSSPWRRAALAAAERSRHQQDELRRLRDALGDIPMLTLPFLVRPLRGAAGIQPLIAAFERAR